MTTQVIEREKISDVVFMIPIIVGYVLVVSVGGVVFRHLGSNIVNSGSKIGYYNRTLLEGGGGSSVCASSSSTCPPANLVGVLPPDSASQPGRARRWTTSSHQCSSIL
ncbi:unnamed protein product [Caenorhabditis nigoni]